MTNPYQPPLADLETISNAENKSGGGGGNMPPNVTGWNQMLSYASFWRRLGAGTVDLLFFLVLTIVLGAIALSSKTTAYVLLPVMWAIMMFYSVVLHAKFGATLGKFVFGISVTCVDGRPIGWPRSFARSAAELIFTAYWLSYVVPSTFALPQEAFHGQSWAELFQTVKQQFPDSYETGEALITVWSLSEFFTMLLNKKRRAVHDFVAGTVVVIRQRMPKPVAGGR